MAVVDGSFWAALDAQIAEKSPASGRAPPIKMIAQPTVTGMRAAPAGVAAPGLRNTSDWTGVLDTLEAAKRGARQQDAQLRAQAAAHGALLQELKCARQKIEACEALMREVRAQSDAKVCEISAQAETRVQAMQIEAEARLREAAERTRAAELRAEVAEGWLQRIEQASRDLLPSDRRVAA